MSQIIDHNSPKIHTALGLKEDLVENVKKIVHDHFVIHTPEGETKRGHEKASKSLLEVIKLARKKALDVEDDEIQEYEATLAYLAYLVGAEIADAKMQQRMQRERLARMIFGGGEDHPLAALFGGRGEEEEPRIKRNSIVMEVDSKEEVDLHQSVIENMAKGNFAKAMGSMILLKDIKEGKKTKPAKKGKGSKSTRKTGPKK